jgi:hypothetical protein
MAINTAGLQDEDGDYSDWIELYNAGDQPADLFGYSITDDASNLTKWRFPHVMIQPGERLVVFASDKDRDNPAKNLHANFRLDGQGEFLALAGPDGTSVQQFSPSYPPQVADIAYGLSSSASSVDLLNEGATARYRVPSDDALRETWFASDFADSSWTFGTTPIGYDTGEAELPAYAEAVSRLGPIAYWRFEETSGTSAGDAGSLGSSLDGTYAGSPDLAFAGPDSSVNPGLTPNSGTAFDGTDDALTTNESILSDLAAFTMMGFIRPGNVAADRIGLWGQNDAIEFGFANPTTLQVWTPEGGSLDVDYDLPKDEWHHVAVVGTGTELRVLIDGNLAGTGGVATASYGLSNSKFNIGGAGIFDASGNYFHGAIDEVAVFDKALTDVQIGGLMNPSGGGPFTGIATNVQNEMKDKASSIHVRIPFTVDDPSRLQTLGLDIKYDDGFIAYINGSEVARVNAPGEEDMALPFDATALSIRPDTLASQFQSFEISDSRDALIAGTNVLAIHALNVSADNTDLLLSPRLVAGVGTVSTNDVGYLLTPSPGSENPPNTGSLGPLVRNVAHTPHQPNAADSIIVTAQVTKSLREIAKVELVYRVMYEDEVTLSMLDNGSGGDQQANDGIYTAAIPGNIAQPGQMVRWYVHATDSAAETGRAPTFEFNTGRNQTAEYFGTMVNDPTVTSQIPILHWFVENTTRAGQRTGTRASLFYNGQFYDNVFVRQRGGSTADNVVRKTNFKFDFKGDTFQFDPRYPLVEEFNLNSTASDKAYVRQSMAFEAYAVVGTPSSISFPMHVRRNGEFYGVFAFIEEPDEEMLERNGLDPDGALYKFYNEFTSPSGARKKTREYEGNDDLAAFVRDVNRLSGPELRNYLYDNVNIPTVLNYLVATVLTHQNDNPHKNHFLYRDSNGSGEWLFIPWDHDLTWGSNWVGTSYSDIKYADVDEITFGPKPSHDLSVIHPSHPFINTEGYREWNNHWNRLMDSVLAQPEIRQMYLRRLRTAMDEFLGEPGTTDSYFDRRFDEYSSAMQADVAQDLQIWANPRWKWGEDQTFEQAMQVIKNDYLAVRRTHLYVTHSIDNQDPPVVKTIVPEFSDSRYFVPTNNSLDTAWTEVGFDDTSWNSGKTGIGFDDAATPRFDELIQSPVRPSDTTATGTSIFVRIPFNMADPAEVKTLTLRMKYDDGFVAYINGTRVVEANLRDGTTNFDSRALAHSNTAAEKFENFKINLANHPGLLRAGANVLAIHGMNTSVTSNDMLILPELVDGEIRTVEIAGIPHGQTGNPPIQFDDVTFDAHPISGNQDEEFVKLNNPNDVAVDLSGWRLSGGIEHTFRPGTVLPAGGSIYVSPDVRAFRARSTGPSGNQGLFVQGNYQGHLSRLGETIELIGRNGQPVDTLLIPADPTDVQQYLRVTEVHYNPPSFEDATEFIELQNISASTTLDLSGVSISQGPGQPFTFAAGTLLNPGSSIVVVSNQTAFMQAYPSVPANQIAGVFDGGLANGGERIKVDDAGGNTVLDFEFGDNDPWPVRADGAGATLELIDKNTPVSEFGKWYRWQGSARFGGTPAADNSVITSGIEVSEVRANSDAPGSDAIELHNTASQPIDVSGWYVSDSPDNFLKYQIPADTILAPDAYLVVDETKFNPTPDNPAFQHFGLSSLGDDVWIIIPGTDGTVASFVDDVHFGATRVNESLSRYADARNRLAPSTTDSFGATSGPHRQSDVVISEAHYNPELPSQAALAVEPGLTSDDLEFVELHNRSAAPIDLTGWRLRGGVDFDQLSALTIPAGGEVVIVSFDPNQPANVTRAAAFRAHYGIDSTVNLIGGFVGRLSDSFDRIQLQSPAQAPPADPANLSYYFEDEVLYDDAAPWPASADGTGTSLNRIAIERLGSNHRAWAVAVPTPGSHLIGTVVGDFNGDTRVTVADIDLLCGQIRSPSPDSGFDLTGDALVTMADHGFLITGVLGSLSGDSNLDGIFNSADLAAVFQAKEYEDGVPGNSGWADGDWNCDGEFGTSDFVDAFLSGAFVSTAVATERVVAQLADAALTAAVRIPPAERMRPLTDRPRQEAFARSSAVIPPPAELVDRAFRQNTVDDWRTDRLVDESQISEDLIEDLLAI